MEDELLDAVNDEVSTEDGVVEIESQADNAEDNVSSQYHFEGNGADMTALVAVISGAIVFFTCITCGLGMYALPFLAIVLGIIGLLMAKNSVKPERTQLWSFLGIGTSLVVILLGLFGFAIYIIMILGWVKMAGY